MVKKIKLTGNRVISNEELGKVTASYENRTLSSEDLQSLRQALTVYYINKGFVNSGAVIPDQEVKEGVIAIQIVEGKLTHIELSGNEWLRDSYIAKRLRLGSEEALNLHFLQERMQLLDQDRRIERLNAQLKPGLQAGEGVLQVLVEEARPYELGVSFNNHYATSVGELRGEIYAGHYNLTGFGDVSRRAMGSPRVLMMWVPCIPFPSPPVTHGSTSISIAAMRTSWKSLSIASISVVKRRPMG